MGSAEVTLGLWADDGKEPSSRGRNEVAGRGRRGYGRDTGPRMTAGEGGGPMRLGLAVHGEGRSPDLILRLGEVTGGFLTMP